MSDNITVQDVVDRVDGAVQQGSKWRARCPIHQGDGKSLEFSQGHTRVLVTCWAGCTDRLGRDRFNEEFLKAISLWTEPTKKPSEPVR